MKLYLVERNSVEFAGRWFMLVDSVTKLMLAAVVLC